MAGKAIPRAAAVSGWGIYPYGASYPGSSPPETSQPAYPAPVRSPVAGEHGPARTRTQQRNNRLTNISSKRQILQILNGTKLRVPADPPMVNENPWNSLTLIFTGSGSSTITASTMADLIATQLGLTFSDTLYFKFRRIRLWGGNYADPIGMDVYSQVVDNSNTVIFSQIDEATAIHRPRVGYEWPRSEQVAPVLGSSTHPVLTVLEQASTTDAWLAYLDVLWRTNATNITRAEGRVQTRREMRGTMSGTTAGNPRNRVDVQASEDLNHGAAGGRVAAITSSFEALHA